MTPVTLVMAYYDNPDMLKEQYAKLRALPANYRDMLCVVVVDDGSPRWPAFAEDLDGIGLQVFRIDVDVRWNQDAARNIGVHHAETNWVLLTDIDHVVSMEAWKQVLFRKWNEHMAYQFHRVSAPEMTQYKHHPNSWLMSRALYNRVGGYDERFAGYYGTDGDFKNRLAGLPTPIKFIKSPLIRYPRSHIADASTTTYARKQGEDGVNIKRIKFERSQEEYPAPRTLTFPYHKVYP